MTTQHGIVCVQDMPSQNMHALWSHGHLKNNKYKERLSLNSPSLPKDRSSKRNSDVPFLCGVMGEGRLTHHKRGGQKLTPDQLCHNLSYFPYFLLKTKYLPQKLCRGLHPSSPFPVKWNLILDSKSPWKYLIHPGYDLHIFEEYLLILFVFLTLIHLLLLR